MPLSLFPRLRLSRATWICSSLLIFLFFSCFKMHLIGCVHIYKADLMFYCFLLLVDSSLSLCWYFFVVHIVFLILFARTVPLFCTSKFQEPREQKRVASKRDRQELLYQQSSRYLKSFRKVTSCVAHVLTVNTHHRLVQRTNAFAVSLSCPFPISFVAMPSLSFTKFNGS